jgi:oxygen-independent coproporphyrinogen-3 oxidase
VPPTPEEWRERVLDAFSQSNAAEGISLYVHLPFCESLCTYCGCNTRITVNHAVEAPYLRTLLQEWSQYLALLGDKPRFREIHLGGGTPTFFSPDHLTWLMEQLLRTGEVASDAEFSFEAHPNSTRREHLEALHAQGFRRVSFGIQDFDRRVQEIVNRVQTVEQVRQITQVAREVGYSSLNFDLIYGLPLQTVESVRMTIERVAEMRPERIAFYSYAHVPWIKRGQRKFTEDDLPVGEEKRKLYETGREMLERLGYEEIGMDHFALAGDRLHSAWKEGTLHRNFMGYTPVHTRLQLGLGVSSISDAWTAFAQNEKKVEDYRARVESGELPIFKGHLLNLEDAFLREQILNLMCRMHTVWPAGGHFGFRIGEVVARLEPMISDGLVEVTETGEGTMLRITDAGRPYLRNACMALDLRLHRKSPQTQLFSAAI